MKLHADASEATWQTTGRAVIRLTLGNMAGLKVHPDIHGPAKRARSRQHAIPLHWVAYLCAWARVREMYELAVPTTFEEVVSMTLF
eukprot:COSAG02_NODE_42978_length_379_cov_0.900000_1_plen_85_part_01